MSKHTPGPWYVEKYGGHHRRVTTKRAHREGTIAVATLHNTGLDFDEDLGDELADARLISAAPDLLAALCGVLKNKNDANAITAAYDAIEKAGVPRES